MPFDCPPGKKLLSETEKQHCLLVLRECLNLVASADVAAKAKHEKLLLSLPSICDTPSLIAKSKNYNVMLEKVEKAIRFYSQKNVYVDLREGEVVDKVVLAV